MSSHTPAPWSLRRNRNGEESGAIIGADGLLVATTGYRASPLDQCREDDDNARLISAAPELKTACELAYEVITSRPGWANSPKTIAALEAICQAMIKATGEAHTPSLVNGGEA